MKQKAIFLDRDGTLIKESHYLSDLSQVQLLDQVPEALARLKQAGYFLGMVTNQSGVARGYFTEAFVGDVFELLNQQLTPHGAGLDAMEYCPHHKDGKPPLNQPCHCRKPLPGMLEQMVEKFNLDLEGSWMLGDKMCDVELGVNAGVSAGLVLSGYGEKEKQAVLEKHPTAHVFAGLSAFADFLLGSE